MLKGLGDIGNLMKIQKEFKNVQKKITSAKLTAESAGGEVKATVSGEYKVLEIVINPDFLKTVEAKKLEAMIMSAVNGAVDQVKDYSAAEMGKLTGDMNIPGLGNFFK